jgi:hypothetical protein
MYAKDTKIPQRSQNNSSSFIPKIFGSDSTKSIYSPIDKNLLMQRTLGNQAYGNMIQAKLKIGEPNDKYEQEADRVAEQVMRVSEPKVLQQTSATPQRAFYLKNSLHLGTTCENGRILLQRTPDPEGGKFPFGGLPSMCKRSSTKDSPSGPPARERYRVRVCTDTNEMFVEEIIPPHKVHFHTLVVTGGEKTPTPKGRFKLKIWEKDYTTPRWKEQSCTKFSEDLLGRNVFGPYIIRFKGGYFIHGTVGPGISPITLNGIAMGDLAGSHGCIRMSNLDIKRLHDGLLSYPVGAEFIVTTCGTPPEADVELVPRLTLSLGAEKKVGFESEFRAFLPTLLYRKLQPYIFTGIGTSGLSGGLGTSIDPFTDMPLFLAGKIGLRTEWFHSIELGGGLEAGWAFGKSRSLRLGIGWEMWQQLNDDKKREHLLNLFLGLRF